MLEAFEFGLLVGVVIGVTFAMIANYLVFPVLFRLWASAVRTHARGR